MIDNEDSINKFKIDVFAVKSFDECPTLAESLKNNRPLIIDFEQTDHDTARRVFDFLSGATYVLDGNIRKIADAIFVFLPENINVNADGK